jgi:hypothetical protein
MLHTEHARLLKPKRTFNSSFAITRSDLYDWHIGLLRVCRTFYNDGVQILYDENKVC